MKQSKNHIEDIIKKIKTTQMESIVVVGDVMLDHYLYGEVQRISPEAPVPVVSIVSEEYKLGGAANVANNIKSLGGLVDLVGVIGEDREGNILKKLLESKKIQNNLVKTKGASTITKTRIIAQSQHLLRIDRENDSSDFSPLLVRSICDLPKSSCVIISDYGKGTIGESLLKELKRWEGKILIDPKKRNYQSYSGSGPFLITPNKKEAEEMSGVKIRDKDTIIKAGIKIINTTDSYNLLITLGSKGMVLFEKHGKKISHLPAMAKKVYDVTGAGDTVISAVALGLSKGLSLLDSCIFANICAGIVVGKTGTATVTLEEIFEEMTKWCNYLNIATWRK